VRSGDVEEDELVSPFAVVGFGGFHGIARVHEVDELHALHDSAAIDVDAGYDPTR
jgi:hypothetical protein